MDRHDLTSPGLADLASAQHGNITWEQALATGIGERELRRQVRSGVLVVKGKRVLASTLTPPSPLAELAAVMLDIGGIVWTSGPTAAALLGADGFRLAPPFHVLIEAGRRHRRPPHLVHTSEQVNAIDRCMVEGIAVTSGARTLIDLAGMRSVTDRSLTGALDSMIRDGHTTEEHLHRRIAALRGRGRYGIPRLLAILEGNEVTRGGHSWLEREFLRLVAYHGLPRPDTQVQMARAGGRIVRVDCRFPNTPVVVELLGYRWHRTAAQANRDSERLNALILAGIEPLQFTYQQVTATPATVIATVRTALSRHLPTF